ncbi:dihydrofolate reductase family protein [Micromonospora inositola]|uniref:Dihydrofolate reductase n=1 Tax=Micromonospora inositola TaxID=47865 RepID=A0A1C5JTX9_9ACTN|nr:dihydrofolate reductase family protein [Micromonospora inositola]SCG73679.1 Dihydrofolate reductase [Micromonospora inositola]
MRKVIASTYITLDGVIENPVWTTPYFDDEAVAYAGAQLRAADALLMGRRTYDGFAAAWPQMPETEDSGAAEMNGIRKYVASTTLTDPKWNNTTVLQGDLVEEVTKLKAQDGKDILMYGYGPVAHTLLKAGLLDEARFWIHPVFVGGGTVTTPLADATATLELADTTVMKSGVIIASYRPAR